MQFVTVRTHESTRLVLKFAQAVPKQFPRRYTTGCTVPPEQPKPAVRHTVSSGVNPMSQVINTNIMSLTTQNNLNKSQSALA
ncbi:MAG TPA: hypothetical protein VFK00_07250, partial [Rhodanobacteraceae bacterium]|nr:hypothetical protein [Rhodanobacteraceae bacterium]